MAQVTKTVLKTYFNTGDLPTESNFIDLIDSSQSTLVAGDNISLTSQSNGSVKIDANVSNNGIITTFNNNNNKLATVLKSFTDNSTPGIAVYIPVNGSSYIGTWDFSDLTAPLGTIVIIQETRNAIANPGLTLNGLGIVNRTQRLLSVKISSTSSMAAAIIIRTFRAWEIVGSVGEVQAAN
jgi:hypothetical protein